MGKISGPVPPSDPAELAEFQAATSTLYRLKEQAFANGNADPVVTRFYAENAMSVGPEGKPYHGRDAFFQTYRPLVNTGSVLIEPIQALVRGDAGWEWANFHVRPHDSTQEPFTFIILFLWVRVDKNWVSPGDFYTFGKFD